MPDSGCVSREPASFRDPCGHIYRKNNSVYRQVNQCYFDRFEHLHTSGLYAALSQDTRLVPHQIVEESEQHKVIRPLQLDFISYPYEWSFGQLQDAARLTLEIHQSALDHGMILKDASGFNIQYRDGSPIFIDTLSFDFYKDNDPWVAYGQFCRHFLGPLLLAHYCDCDLNNLQIVHLDGIPLDIVSRMLPARTRISPFIQANIHLHAKSLAKHQGAGKSSRVPGLSLNAHKNIIQSMLNFIDALKFRAATEWSGYYEFANYEKSAFEEKERFVQEWISDHQVKRVWDIGGNNGHFSRLIDDACDVIICSDIDPAAVDENYRTNKEQSRDKIIPLVVDYTNPPPAVGFDNVERRDLRARIDELGVDCILALALVHHLCISNNCSFEMLATSFSAVAEHLLIEFVAPDDSWATSLLDAKRGARELFSDYNRSNFEAVFSRYYEIVRSVDITNSERTLYHMIRRQ